MRDKTKQSLYFTWANMIQRCENKNRPDFKHRGGRGISVCERWRVVIPRGTGFNNFCEDMGPRPFGMTLDRFPNNNGNYEPSNCRWATRREQTLNSRNDMKPAVAAAKIQKASITHCPKGHEYTVENTYIHKTSRSCKTCRAIYDRWIYYDKKIPIEQLDYPRGKPGNPRRKK